MRFRHVRLWGLLAALLCARIAPACEKPAADVARPTGPSGEAIAVEHGRLTRVDGLPVLELWGTRAEMAYAHGYLQAREIVRLFDEFLLTDAVLPNLALYSSVVLPSQRVRWDWQEYEPELEALLEGMRARLGATQVRSVRLERELSVDDLMASNSLPDWNGLFCSSFSAWGEMTVDGGTLTARNLDYDFTPAMAESQIVLIQRGAEGRKPWIAVTWPGLLGPFTAVNGDGLGVFSHDSNSLSKSSVSGFTPRGLIYREVLERAGGETALADVAKILRARRVICGNNLHISAPRRGSEQPACVFEYDANSQTDGVTERLDDATANVLDGPIAGGKKRPLTAPPVAGTLVCTNHMRTRKPCDNRCHRYAKLMVGLHERAEARKPLDCSAAFELITTAAGKSTLHSVVLEANHGRLHVRIPAIQPRIVIFDYAEWFARPTAN